jgi:transcriptional regulator with XRE-family HTH domain
MVQSLIAMPIECRPGFPMRNTTMPPFSAGRETPPRDQTRAPDTRTAMYSEALLVAQLRLETTLQLVGYWLRAIREALGMTVRQFAKAAGTAPSTAQAAERAEARGDISLSTLTRYAEVLGCELRGSHPDRAEWPMCGSRLTIGHPGSGDCRPLSPPTGLDPTLPEWQRPPRPLHGGPPPERAHGKDLYLGAKLTRQRWGGAHGLP